MNAIPPTPQNVRDFLLAFYSQKLKDGGFIDVQDNFDLLLEGVIDSMGVLELVSALEKEYGVELDMSGMDTEKLTVIGPLAAYVATQVGSAPKSGS